MTKYRHNSNIVYSCKYHVVFCPKYRRKVLTPDIVARMKEIMEQVAASHEFEIMESEVMLDHVHILLEVDPQWGIHRAIKAIKGVSSRLLRQEFPILKKRLPSLWTNSYFVSTVGGAPLEIVKQYIAMQHEH